MNEKLSFEYEFKNTSPTSLKYEVDKEVRVDAIIEDGIPVLYADKTACEALAKIFVQLAKGTYDAGFHVHLNKDFDSDKKEILRITVVHKNNSP